MAKRIEAFSMTTDAMSGMLRPISPMPSLWTTEAPTCLPRPTVIILHGPLSCVPRKALCGLRRQETMMPSAL